MFGPPRRFSKILISRLIFFFFTGCKGAIKIKQSITSNEVLASFGQIFIEISHQSMCRCCYGMLFIQTFKIFTTTFSSFVMFIASNTSLYLPRPNFRTSS